MLSLTLGRNSALDAFQLSTIGLVPSPPFSTVTKIHYNNSLITNYVQECFQIGSLTGITVER